MKHYYCSTRYDWAVGATREDAVKRVLSETNPSVFEKHLVAVGGMAAVICRVDLPSTAAYSIADWLPATINNGPDAGKPVPIAEVEYVRLTSRKGDTVPNTTD